jgi:D-Tyr-tRNAtyr deacylase
MFLFQRTHSSLVSQFTLLASTKKGSKPDFHGALGGDQAKELYQLFVSKVQQGYAADRVKDGVFQAMMVYPSTAPFLFDKAANDSSPHRK